MRPNGFGNRINLSDLIVYLSFSGSFSSLSLALVLSKFLARARSTYDQNRSNGHLVQQHTNNVSARNLGICQHIWHIRLCMKA